MITILNTDKEQLMTHIRKCRGCVYLHLDDGSFCDLKNDDTASKLFRLMELPKSGIGLTLSDARDIPAFLQYMASCSK